jgi:capsular polysaccharide biosynthesis protein
MATLAKVPVTRVLKEQIAAEFEMAQEYVISAVVIPDTNILEISTDGPDPNTAAAIANAAARQTAVYSANFYETFELKIIDPAKQARLIRPSLTRNFVVGGLLGLSVGLVLAFLAAYITSVRIRRKASEQKPAENYNESATPDRRLVDY